MDKELMLIVQRTLVKQTNIFLEKIEEMDVSKLNTTQSNLITEGIRKASSVEELLLFIAYQEAKDKDKVWSMKSRGGKTVANNVIDSIKEILNIITDKIIEEVKISDITNVDQISEDDNRIIRLKIVEKFLGYLNWKVTIVNNM